MKKSLFIAALAFALVLLPATAALADSWTGRISDDHCGAGGAKDGHAACAKKCVGAGGKYVFVTADSKVFAIDNQELASQHLDHEVVVTGSVDGTNIKVESIAKKP
jgi:Protein of unknown function (DUF5818)